TSPRVLRNLIHERLVFIIEYNGHSSDLHSFPTRRSSDLERTSSIVPCATTSPPWMPGPGPISTICSAARIVSSSCSTTRTVFPRSEEHTSELQSLAYLVCRLLLEKKKHDHSRHQRVLALT